MSDGGKRFIGGLQGKLRFEQSNNRIVGFDDANLMRLLLAATGQDFNFKIAPEGKDVRTATDDELIFNSDRNLFKIVDWGEVPITKPAVLDGQSATTSEQADHDLDYIPLVIAFIVIPSPQAVDSDIIKFFGSGITNANGFTSNGVNIVYHSDEQVTAGVDKITFSWTIHNKMGFGEPAMDCTIKYFLLTTTSR